MKNLIQALKNASRITLVFVVIFFFGVLFSLYTLYSLPHDLVYQGNVANVSLATWVFIKLSTVIIATFLVGIIALGIAIQLKKETIVYVEKKKEEDIQSNTITSDQVETLDLEEFSNSITVGTSASALQEGLNKICDFVQAGQGGLYVHQNSEGKREVELTYGFALAVAETAAPRFEFGEGLVGQVAASGNSVYIDEIPEGYITIISGLGTSSPRYLLILPMKQDGALKGVLEVATFQPVNEIKRKQVEEMASVLSKRLN